MFTGLLLAAGSGHRFGGEEPKQFVELNGQPVIEHSIRMFEQTDEIAAYGILTLPDYQSRIKTIISALPTKKCNFVFPGGKTRRQSVEIGLEKLCKDMSHEPEVVAIHDAARPAVTSIHLQDLFQCFCENSPDVKGVIPGLPVRDTVKRVRSRKNSDYVSETVPREQLRLIQTPQVFDFDFLTSAHSKWSGPEPTDDAMMVEKIGGEVLVMPGLPENVKLTYPGDLELIQNNLLKLSQSVVSNEN